MTYNKRCYKVVFTNDAIKDMDNIFKYISETLYSPQSAKKIINKIIDRIDNLKYMPKKHAIFEKNNKLQLKYRRLFISNYVVIYTIDEKNKKVFIINMYYSRSDYFNKI